jgi:glycosyltransferase involved in cell wall biosynthesis
MRSDFQLRNASTAMSSEISHLTRTGEERAPLQPLRIALIAPPLLPLPPRGYAGTERIVAALAIGLHERGHSVTAFCAGDSDLPCEVVPVTPRALWPQGYRGDLRNYFELSLARAWGQQDRFDVFHSHVDTAGFAMARHASTPVVTTLHGRLDVGGAADLIDAYPDIPLVAISESQRRWNPDANWVGTIHHGLDFSATPRSDVSGDYLLLVGRLTREKGIVEAIALARRTGRRLVIAAKAHERDERTMLAEVVRPAVDEGIVDWRGEVSGTERDELMAGALATIMLGGWPEPFGLVAIESMATGTPVIARRSGAYTEIIQHGVTGFLVDDEEEAVLAVERVNRIDRRIVQARARDTFSVDRMVSRYEEVFRAVIDRRKSTVEAPGTRRRARSRERVTLTTGMQRAATSSGHGPRRLRSSRDGSNGIGDLHRGGGPT